MFCRAAWLVVGADVSALLGLLPDWPLLARHLCSPRHWLADSGADQVLAALTGAAIWLVAAWVALGLLAALAARLPGGCGRVAARISVVVLPAVVQRVVAGTVGLGVLLAPVGAGAQAASLHRTAVPTGTGIPGPAWPTAPAPIPHSSAPHTAPAQPLPGPGWPVGTSESGRPTPTAPRSPPAPPRPRRPAAPIPSHTRSDAIRVDAGDSLWLLASQRLHADAPHVSDADIASYWPQIYAANRAVIGDDPALITPGQVFHLPAPNSQESP